MFEEFFASRIEFFNKFLTNYRKKVVSEELKIAKISPEEKVLFIGSGILPSTPLMILEKTNATVVSIDNNIKAVEFAVSYIKKKGSSDKIRIEYDDGVNYPVENFDVIFIATNVWPIETILRHISLHMKNSARLICRDIKNDINDILEREGLSDKFSVESYSEHPSGPNYKSVLLIRKE